MDHLEVLQMLAEYYSKELSKSQIKIYLKTLEDILPEDLEKAVYKWIKEGRQFFPKVNELRSMGPFYKTDVVQGETERLNMYWNAMNIYNNVLAGRMDESELNDRRVKYVFDRVEFIKDAELVPD